MYIFINGQVMSADCGQNRLAVTPWDFIAVQKPEDIEHTGYSSLVYVEPNISTCKIYASPTSCLLPFNNCITKRTIRSADSPSFIDPVLSNK